MLYRYFSKGFCLFSLMLFLIACGRQEERCYQGYIESENIYLASPYSGQLKQLAIQRGAVVKKGQLLFALDPYPELLNVQQTQFELTQAEQTYQNLVAPKRREEIEAIKAQIEQVQAQIVLAELRVKRYRELYAKKVAAKDILDEAVELYKERSNLKKQYQANLALAQQGARVEEIRAQAAQVNALRKRVANAQWMLSQKSLCAPVDGLIYDTYYRPGEFVPAQQPVLSLLSPNLIYVQFYVPLVEANRLSIGKKITFSCETCSEKYPAVISYVSSEAEFVPPLVYSRDNVDKLVFRVQARLKAFNRFKPGEPVLVFIN